MANRPIDSFVKYFLDIKPYHTKILEIVEQYKFQDNLDITLGDSINFVETWANNPLCVGTGFGLDFDDDSGFDSESNCDLFECVGGFGLIFDNSDILVETPIVERDFTAGTLTVSGDHRYDKYFQIVGTSGSNTVRLLGNVVSQLAAHYLFLIVPKNKYQIMEITYNGFYVSGDVSQQFLNKNEFTVHQSNLNDNVYSVLNASYNSTETRTFIEVYQDDLDATAAGYILVASDSKNNSTYLRTDVSYDGTYTNITLHGDTPIPLISETEHGCVVLRTGFIAPRRIWVDSSSEWKIVQSDYDLDADETTLTLEGDLTPLGLESFNVQLIGYMFGAGFDGFNECGPPSQHNLHIGFSELLQIEVISYDITPTPTPTPVPPSTLYLARLLDGIVGDAFTYTIEVEGDGTPPYTFTLESGTLPSGLTLGSGSGIISGTPSETGTFSIVVKITDAAAYEVLSYYDITVISV